MDRFASNTINNVDRKGRVSVPASFRAVLKNQSELHALMSVDHRVVEAGGKDMIEWYQQRLEQLDPFSQEYEDWSFYINGDALELKLDGEGRFQLNDRIREQTGISDKVLFEGRGRSFWIWEPGAYEDYRSSARERVRSLKRSLGSRAVMSSGAQSGSASGEQGS